MGDPSAIQHNARQDYNRFPSLIGVSGTPGTSDTAGTAEIVKIGANPTTGALYVESTTSGVAPVSGTVQVNMVPVTIGTSYHTVGTTGAAVWGTLVAASGAGTRQYVPGVDIIVVAGTMEVAVTNIGVGGSTGNGVLARGWFPPGGGVSKVFNPIQASGTNGTLSYWLGGAGTVDITIQYWQGV